MKHEIKIYGDIVPFNSKGLGKEFDLSDLNNLLNGLTVNEGDELLYGLHTFGGDTTTAFAMHYALKRFKNDNKITLTSRPEGYCASSGVILQLAADKKIGNKYLRPFVHNAWVKADEIDRNDAQTLYEELDVVDNEIAELYSENTSITKELALQFMSENRNLSLQECLDYGFFTEIEDVRVVENAMIFNSIINRNSQNRQNLNKNMANKNKDAERKSILNRIEKFLLGTKNKIVFTADNSELDFYELDDDATPVVGDKAKYDGKPAGDSNNGEYTMPSGEVYKFTGEELTEIVPKEDGGSDLEAENAALTTENETLKTEIENLKKEKVTLNKKLSDATSIINGFKNLTKDDDEDEEEKRDPNHKFQKNEAPKSRVGNAINKFKNRNTDGDNK